MALTKADSQVATITSSDVGLGSVTNESKATMFTSPVFTGLVGLPGAYESLQSISTSGGTTTVDLSLGTSTWMMYPAGWSSNVTAAFTNAPSGTGKLLNATFILAQPGSGTARVITAASVAGVSKTIYWAGGSAPSGTLGKFDVITLTYISDGGGTQFFLGSLVTYG